MGTETRVDFFERMNRRAEIQAIEDKRRARAEIERQIEDFKRRGGTVAVLDSSISATSKPVVYNGNVIGYDSLKGE